jgi:hypothetical protein
VPPALYVSCPNYEHVCIMHQARLHNLPNGFPPAHTMVYALLVMHVSNHQTMIVVASKKHSTNTSISMYSLSFPTLNKPGTGIYCTCAITVTSQVEGHYTFCSDIAASVR